MNKRATLVFTLLTVSSSRAFAQDGDVLEVDVATKKSLPRATFIPADAASLDLTKELARVVRLACLFEPAIVAPGTSVTGRAVRVKVATESAGVSLEARSSKGDGPLRRRFLALSSTERDLELARLADAVNLDLSGERSNLSGRILYTDTSVPGERTVHVMLASGTSDKMVSPAGAFAVSGDFGPGGVPFFAMGLPGQMLSIHATGVVAPLHVNVTGSLQAIAFSPDGEKAAVVSGDGSGGAVFAGHLEGIMTRLATRGMAITPAVGPAGEIAYAAGEPGALHVFIDDKQVAPAGISPAFCDKGKQHRLAFAVMGGGVQIVSRDGGGFLGGVSGGTPACSADGRTLAVVRHGKSGGIFLVNDEALGAVKIHAGDAAGLRWSAGGVLPPEG